MASLADITAAVVTSYGVVFLNFGLAVLVMRNKRRVHYLASVTLLDIGVVCIAGGASIRTGLSSFALNAATFVPIAALAPLGNAFVLESLGTASGAKRFSRALLAGTLVIAAAGLILQGMTGTWRGAFVLEYGWLFIAFSGIAFLDQKAVRSLGRIASGAKRFSAILWGDAIAIGILAAFRMLDLYTGLYLLWILLILSIVGTLFLAYRSPETYRLIRAEAAKNRYERARLSDASARVALDRLRAITEDKELLLDPELSLERLAAKVGINAVELSELLNLHLGKNYNAFVNAYRIEEAKALLLAKPETTVLEISFECGFNSKSVFNAAFKKETGLTPTEYREKMSGRR